MTTTTQALRINPALVAKIGFKLSDPPFSPYKNNYTYYDYRRWARLSEFLLAHDEGTDGSKNFNQLDVESLSQLIERGVVKAESSAGLKERLGLRRAGRAWSRVNDAFVVRRELQLRLKLETKLRDHHPRTQELPVEGHRDAARAIVELLDGSKEVEELSTAVVTILRDYGVLVGESEACGARPLLCTRTTERGTEDGTTAPHGAVLRLNPHVEHSLNLDDVLSKFPRFERTPFSERPNVAVTNVHSGVVEFFTLTTAQRDLLEHVSQGGAVDVTRSPQGVDQDAVNGLRAMNLIMAEDDAERFATHWSTQLEDAREQLARFGCAHVRKVLSPAQLQLARDFGDAMTRDKYLHVDDWTGAVNRQWLESDDITTLMHYMLTPLINRVWPRELKPTYNYLNTYNRGAELPMHKDPGWANKLTSTFTLRKGHVDAPWPLLVVAKGRTFEFDPDPGDIVIMRPRQTHGRKGALQTTDVTNMLFWFQPTYRTGFKYGQEFGFDKHT